jgi:hypothetical protein
MRFVAWVDWFIVLGLQVIAWLFFAMLSLYSVGLLMMVASESSHINLIIICGPVVLAMLIGFAFALVIKLTSVIPSAYKKLFIDDRNPM